MGDLMKPNNAVATMNYNDDWWGERVDTVSKESFSDNFSNKIMSMSLAGVYIIRLLPPLKKTDLFRTMGQHWNVFSGGDELPKGPIGCPRVNWGEQCIICDAIDQAIAQKRGDYKDFYGLNNPGVTRRFIVRAIFQEFRPDNPSEDVSKLPQPGSMVYLALPTKVRKTLGDWIKEGKKGVRTISPAEIRQNLFDVDKGYPISIHRSKKLDGWYDTDFDRSGDPEPISSEFRNTHEWEEIDTVIPRERAVDIKSLVMKFIDDVPLVVSEYIENLSAINVGCSEVKQIDVSKISDDPPWSDNDEEKKRLAALEQELANL